MYYIKRAFALLVMGGFIGLALSSYEYEDYVLTGISGVLAVITFFIFRGIKKKKIRKAQRAAAEAQMAQMAQNPPQLRMRDQIFLAVAQEMINSNLESCTAPSFDNITVPAASSCNREAERREQEEQERRQREEYQRMSDQSRREYERLKYNDPQCRDERTKVAEYNMNYFARKAKGKW